MHTRLGNFIVAGLLTAAGIALIKHAPLHAGQSYLALVCVLGGPVLAIKAHFGPARSVSRRR